jgi:hypothetical protein
MTDSRSSGTTDTLGLAGANDSLTYSGAFAAVNITGAGVAG